MADLSQVAEQLGVPEPLIARSSAARASAEGLSQDEVLEAWLSGGSIEAPPAGDSAALPEEAPEGAPPEEKEEAPEEAPSEEKEAGEPVEAAGEVEAPEPVEEPAMAAAEEPQVARPRTKGPPPLREPDRSDDHRLVLAGTISLLLLGLLMTVVLPAIELAGTETTTLASTWRNYPAMARGEASPELAEAGLDPELVASGRELYVREGCWYCHTQMVRPIITDAGLGPVTRAGDLVFEDPPALGERRVGPDLTHVGSREPTDQVEFISAYLADPRSQRRWSTMPSYGFLSEQELAALAHYLVSLNGSAPEEEADDAGEDEATTTTISLEDGATTTTAEGGG